jgi:hypothetical protein
MHLNISVENYDSPQQIRSLANALIAFSTELETNGRTSGEVGSASSSSTLGGITLTSNGAGEPGQTEPKPKRTRKAAAATPEPEEDPDTPPEDSDDGEESEPAPKEAKANGKLNGKAAGDDKALRQEVLERFASYADEAGVLEGKSLLGEFNATKFSEVAGTDLRAFAKRLTVLEASL